MVSRKILSDAKRAAIWRFFRTIIPQIPALVAVIGEQTKLLNLPEWVAPTLMLVGAIATAVDKFLRAIKAY